MDGAVVEALASGLGATTFLVGFSSVRLRAQRDRALSRSDAAAADLIRAGATDRLVTDSEVDAAASAFEEANRADPIGRWTVALGWAVTTAMLCLLVAYKVIAAPTWSVDPATWQMGSYVALYSLVLTAGVALLGTADYAWVSRDLRERLDASVLRLAARTIDLQRAGTIDAALEVAERLATKAPSWPWVHVFIAHAQNGQGKHAQALSANNRAVALDPSNPWWRVARAETHLSLGQHDAALADIEHVTEHLTGEARIEELRGAALYGLGRHEEAAKAFTRALTIDPDNAAVRFERGRALISADSAHREAPSAALVEILLDDGRRVAVDAISQVGMKKLNARDSVEAIRDFTFAITRDPKNGDAYCWRAVARLETGDEIGADEDFSHAQQLGIPQARVLSRKARALRRSGRVVEAEAALSEAIAKDPTAAMHRDRSFLRHELGRLEAAIEDLQAAIDLAPENFDYRLHRASMLIEQGYLDDGHAQFSHAESQNPPSVHDYGLWAETLLNAGQSQMARDVVDRGVERCVDDPNLGRLLALSGSIYQSLRLYRRALDDFGAASEAGAPAAEVSYRRSLCLAAMGDHDAAFNEIQVAAETRWSFQYGALATRATMFRGRKDADAALIDLDRALMLAPNSTDLLVARGCLISSAFGDSSRARGDFDSALLINERDLSALLHRVATWDAQSQIAEMERDVDRVADVAGASSEAAIRCRATMFERRHMFAEAASEHRTLLERDPDDEDTLWNLGAAYVNMSNFEDAEVVFRDLLRRDPASLRARLSVAVALSQQHRSDEAVAAFRETRGADEPSASEWMTRNLHAEFLPEYGRVMNDWALSESSGPSQGE